MCLFTLKLTSFVCASLFYFLNEYIYIVDKSLLIVLFLAKKDVCVCVCSCVCLFHKSLPVVEALCPAGDVFPYLYSMVTDAENTPGFYNEKNGGSKGEKEMRERHTHTL